MKQTEKTAKNETEPMEQAILRAAERLFLDKGFALTSTTEIAREAGCNIALYGHTHVSFCRYRDGLYVMNPGSPAQPRDGTKSYGIIDITDTGILPYVVKLNP